MNETRMQIMKAVEKADLESALFLQSINSSCYEDIISKAARDRSEDGESRIAEIADLFEESLLDGEERDFEESFEDFVRRIAYRVKNAGTNSWIKRLKKGTAESIVNGMREAGNCKITLENGDSFDELKLARDWEMTNKEILCKKGDWSIL